MSPDSNKWLIDWLIDDDVKWQWIVVYVLYMFCLVMEQWCWMLLQNKTANGRHLYTVTITYFKCRTDAGPSWVHIWSQSVATSVWGCWRCQLPVSQSVPQSVSRCRVTVVVSDRFNHCPCSSWMIIAFVVLCDKNVADCWLCLSFRNYFLK